MSTFVSPEVCARLVALAVQQHQALLEDDLAAFDDLMQEREALVAVLAIAGVDGELDRQGMMAALEQVNILDERMLALLAEKLSATASELNAVHVGKIASGTYLTRQGPESTVSRHA